MGVCVADFSDVLALALEIMVLGMVIVFGFLGLLIVCVDMMSRVINRYFPDAPIPAKQKRVSQNSSVPPAIVAAVASAVQQHRNRARS